MIVVTTLIQMMEEGNTGHLFCLGDTPISWCSQKQDVVALSSCEAEFMAATEAAKQAIWLQELMSEIIGRKIERTLIRVDNKSAIALAKNHVSLEERMLDKPQGRLLVC